MGLFIKDLIWLLKVGGTVNPEDYGTCIWSDVDWNPKSFLEDFRRRFAAVHHSLVSCLAPEQVCINYYVQMYWVNISTVITLNSSHF
jgi:hypothetical protein